jgi:uncharacterized protein (TIGR02391 family)
MANDAVEWLATVSRHCRKMIELAGLAIRDREEYETPAAKNGLREALATHKDALRAILPENFPNSRIGDLSRHIHFCDHNDWNDIVLFDVPDILAKAETYAVDTHSDQSGGIEEFLHARFRPRLELTMRAENPDFHALILACSVDLATLFKRKSGSNDDSDGEIGRVFNRDAPVLMVPAQLQSETERNLQRGALLLMQGWRAFIRNPHAHEERPADKEYMVHALMLMSFIARIIDGATHIEPPEPNHADAA